MTVMGLEMFCVNVLGLELWDCYWIGIVLCN
jgi:hypothetical protein